MRQLPAVEARAQMQVSHQHHGGGRNEEDHHADKNPAFANNAGVELRRIEGRKLHGRPLPAAGKRCADGCDQPLQNPRDP